MKNLLDLKIQNKQSRNEEKASMVLKGNSEVTDTVENAYIEQAEGVNNDQGGIQSNILY